MSTIRASAPQLLPPRSSSIAESLQIQLSSSLGPSVSINRATLNMPLLPPSRRDAQVSRPESPQPASLVGISNATRSFTETQWRLPVPLRTAYGRPQTVPVALEIEGACLDAVTSALLQTPTGKVWPANITERPALPAGLLVQAAGSEGTAQQRQSWAQRVLGLVTARLRCDLHDTHPASSATTVQVLRVGAALPLTEAQQLVDGLLVLSVGLQSDWDEVSAELSLQPRRVWVTSEDPNDTLDLISQLQPPLLQPLPPEAASVAHVMVSDHADELPEREDPPLPAHSADDQPASGWRTRLRDSIRILSDLQQRTVGLAAARLYQPSPSLPCAYRAGVYYVAITQHQQATFAARLQSFAGALQQQTSSSGGKGQPPSLWHKHQLSTIFSAPAPVTKPDGVLILLRADAAVPSGAAPVSASLSNMAPKPWQLEQLIITASELKLPVLVVLLGSSPWSRTMGADLTRWARTGASVVHVASLSHNPQAAAAASASVQNAIYTLLSNPQMPSLPARSKL